MLQGFLNKIVADPGANMNILIISFTDYAEPKYCVCHQEIIEF